MYKYLNNKKIMAAMNLIAFSEGTQNIGFMGYNAIVGGKTFSNYCDHPRKAVWIESIKKWSTAAGRYQILAHVYDDYKKILNLPNFLPENQDKICYQLMSESDCIADFINDDVAAAVLKLGRRWASFPGELGKHQHQHDELILIDKYHEIINGMHHL